MKLVNETTELVNRLTSVIDDSKECTEYGGIMGVTVNFGIAEVHMHDNFFLEQFKSKNYDVECDECSGYPYQLKIELDGVVFFAIMDTAKIVDLKCTHPDHFEYISRVLQL